MYTKFDKAVVALIMAGVGLVNLFYPGHLINVDPNNVNAFLALLTPVLVYLVPNLPKDPS